MLAIQIATLWGKKKCFKTRKKKESGVKSKQKVIGVGATGKRAKATKLECTGQKQKKKGKPSNVCSSK